MSIIVKNITPPDRVPLKRALLSVSDKTGERFRHIGGKLDRVGIGEPLERHEQVAPTEILDRAAAPGTAPDPVGDPVPTAIEIDHASADRDAPDLDVAAAVTEDVHDVRKRLAENRKRTLHEFGMFEHRHALGTETRLQRSNDGSPGNGLEIAAFQVVVEAVRQARAHLLNIECRQEALEIADEITHLDLIALEHFGDHARMHHGAGHEIAAILGERLSEQVVARKNERMRAGRRKDFLNHLAGMRKIGPVAIFRMAYLAEQAADIVLAAVLPCNFGAMKPGFGQAGAIGIDQMLETDGAGFRRAAMKNDFLVRLHGSSVTGRWTVRQEGRRKDSHRYQWGIGPTLYAPPAFAIVPPTSRIE
jgi:hypothetical protein